MSDFFLKFPIPKASFSLDHTSRILLIGSCFSDEIAAKASYFGLNVKSNPFGTIFHPVPIARFLAETIEGPKQERIEQLGERHISWDAAFKISQTNKDQIIHDLDRCRKEWKKALENANVLFVTFGTAWGYYLKENALIVANCNKVPSVRFEKKLTDQQDILAEWLKVIKLLQVFNPGLKIIFTVSPVRHIRDGLVGNNQSKAILIDAVRMLCEQEGVEYFPSYEILVDELRDYRFFKEDRVHPSEEAVHYVWKRLEETYLSEPARSLCSEVDKYRKFAAHVVQGNESVNHDEKRSEMLETLRRKIKDFNE